MAARKIHEEDQRSAKALQDQLLETMSLTQVRSYFERNLQQSGTNTRLNQSDPQGDGDQSRITQNHQFYRDMYATGGDMPHILDAQLEPLSLFSRFCLMGGVESVQRILEKYSDDTTTTTPPPELIRQLETRETCLRLSPLLLLVSMGKNLSMGDDQFLDHRQIQVAALLLKYGARPDARDVIGKTVCHYGMGAMATSRTMKIVDLCMKAQESSHLFGKLVELQGLVKSPALNGNRGWCKGYDNGRRLVYLVDAKKTITVKPENLKLVDSTPIPSPTKLCDIPDRLGVVCLLEVLQADRQDVAEILLKQYHANLDIQDCDGCSPQNLSLKTGAFSQVAAMINKAAGKQAAQQEILQTFNCTNCGKPESPDTKLQFCALCKKVQYCSKACQSEHWKRGGHKKQCKELLAKQQRAIVLEPPQNDGMFYTQISTQLKTKGNSITLKAVEGYRKPNHVAVGELFDIKVQGGGPDMPLMVYDKTRECSFDVSPGTRGFDELRQAMLAQPAWQGRKTFVAASFDAKGDCTVYPGLTSLHKW